jgi:CheY-like chemotaxis protein
MGGRAPQLRILLVDDDHDVADSLAAVLKILDYDVCIAYSGQEAINLAGRYRPDIVILDVNMRGMNGLQIARHLKKDRRLAATSFIAHTAADGPLVRRVVSEIGFQRLIVKRQHASLTTILDALLEIPEERRFET